MEEKNPLGNNHLKPCTSELNKSGRPTNEKIIIFGPQPKSLVSQMLQKITTENDVSLVHLDASNKTNIKCTELKNCDALYSSIHVTLDPDVDHSKIMNSNKELKKYLCDFPNCKYACKLSSNLIKHKRIHTSEKPYLCHLCSFRSNFINSLKVHQRIHTAEKPYVCNYCGYRCNSSSNLKKHCKHRHSSSASIQEQNKKMLS